MIFIVVIGSGVFTLRAQRNQLFDQVDDRLTSTPMPPGAGPRQVREGEVPDRGALQPVDRESISDLYIAVVDADGLLRPVIEGQLLDDVPDVEPVLGDLPDGRSIATIEGIDGVSRFRVLFVPSPEGVSSEIIAVPIDDLEDTLRQMTLRLLGVIALISVALIVIASWVSRFGLRPIREMTDVAEAISLGDRERRAAVDDTEAGRLGHAFNTMLDDRDRSDARLRQFVSNASHELRTPLTSIRGYLDLYVAGGFRKPGELDDAIRRLQGEAERMSLLVEDLLVLATFDEEQPLDITSVRIDDMARDVVALALAAHPDRHIEVDAGEVIEARVDRLRLHQALAGLVDNAVRHTPDDGVIRVSARADDGVVELSVIDQGPGLTASEAAEVFDRFSRGDRSRARKTGGSGLGLSITQAIVHAHGGDISVTATPGDGAAFTISVPGAQAS